MEMGGHFASLSVSTIQAEGSQAVKLVSALLVSVGRWTWWRFVAACMGVGVMSCGPIATLLAPIEGFSIHLLWVGFSWWGRCELPFCNIVMTLCFELLFCHLRLWAVFDDMTRITTFKASFRHWVLLLIVSVIWLTFMVLVGDAFDQLENLSCCQVN